LLVAGCSALVQRDIKRVLAYSTMSQIGYMFLALGVGAWTAAMFHFMTHAFFKALLFLAAGALIHALRNEQDLFRMGGLRRALPVVYWTFLSGAASLVALPWVTAGFHSKELILEGVWHSVRGGAWLWAAGVVGALITALYSTRMVWLAFFGARSGSVDHLPGRRIRWVLIVLALLSITGGFVEPQGGADGEGPLARFLAPVLAGSEGVVMEAGGGWLISWLPVMASVAGIAGVWTVYSRYPRWGELVMRSRIVRGIHQYWLEGWGFDWVYDRMIRRPFVWLAEIDPRDMVDALYVAIGGWVAWLNRMGCRTQTGSLRQYAVGIAVGLAVILALGLILGRSSGPWPAQPGDARPADGEGVAGEGTVIEQPTDSSA
jgi:NADH-quinone oxidoreductase subunit L